MLPFTLELVFQAQEIQVLEAYIYKDWDDLQNWVIKPQATYVLLYQDPSQSFMNNRKMFAYKC